MNPDTPMKTPDYKHLAKIGAEAAKCCIHWSEINETFARAVIEEYERLRMEQVGEGMPSVEECIRVWHRSGGINQGPEAVRSLMLAAFERQLEAEKAPSEKVDRLSKTIENMLARIHRDGGHHTDTVGFEQSMVDADEVISRLNEAQDRLTAAEKRLGEIAKLPEKWKQDPGVLSWTATMRLVEELEKALSRAPTAEEVSREEFEKEWLAYCPGDDFTVDEKAAAWHMWQARAAKEVKAPAE